MRIAAVIELELGRGLGHVRRMEAICAALRRADHHVSLLTNDPAAARQTGSGAFDLIERAPNANRKEGIDPLSHSHRSRAGLASMPQAYSAI